MKPLVVTTLQRFEKKYSTAILRGQKKDMTEGDKMAFQSQVLQLEVV